VAELIGPTKLTKRLKQAKIAQAAMKLYTCTSVSSVKKMVAICFTTVLAKKYNSRQEANNV
jgi:hypothetical protein